MWVLLTLLEIALFLGVNCCILFTVYLWMLHKKYSHIPGPPRSSFFLGNLPEINRETKKGSFLLETMRRWHLTYGDNFVFFMAYKPVFFSADQATIRELLVGDDHPKDKYLYSIFSDVFGSRFAGNALFAEIDQEKWRQRRSTLNPAFHRTFLRRIIPVFNAITDKLVDRFTDHAIAGVYINISEELQNVALDIIGKVAFGMDIDSLNQPSKYNHSMSIGLEAVQKILDNPFLKFNPVQERTLKEDSRNACTFLRKTGYALVKQRQLQQDRGVVDPEDILSLVIRANADTPEELVDDIISFFIAGTDTTAAALSFALREIGRRPDIMERLIEEIDRVFGGKTIIDFESLNKMEYTEMVIKETLRMYPPAPFTFKNLRTDFVSGNYFVPKNTAVMMSQFISGRNTASVKKAEEFLPERFGPGSDLRPPVYTYFPFALGPRNCIGQHFAMIEMKMIFAKMIQKLTYELHPDQQFDIEQKIVLAPKGGVKIKLQLR